MQGGWPLGFKWEVAQVVCVLAVPRSCSWPRAGERGVELGPLKHLLQIVLLSTIHSGAKQGRVLPPLRRDKLPWLNA